MSLQQLIDGVSRVTGVAAVAVVDYEGIPIEMRAAFGAADAERLAAWAAELGRLAAETAESWDGGRLQLALFESSMGSLMLADLGRGFLVVSGDPTLNTGRLRLEVEKAVEPLRQFLAAGLTSRETMERAASA